MNLKKIFQIKEANPPATPRIPPTAKPMANIYMESNRLHAKITRNLDSTIFDLETGFASKSLIVLSENSRPNTHAAIKVYPISPSGARLSSNSVKYIFQLMPPASLDKIIPTPIMIGPNAKIRNTNQNTLARIILRISQCKTEKIFIIYSPLYIPPCHTNCAEKISFQILRNHSKQCWRLIGFNQQFGQSFRTIRCVVIG
ncbi:hypothetical protein D1872_237690 [compost metagenome]